MAKLTQQPARFAALREEQGLRCVLDHRLWDSLKQSLEETGSALSYKAAFSLFKAEHPELDSAPPTSVEAVIKNLSACGVTIGDFSDALDIVGNGEAYNVLERMMDEKDDCVVERATNRAVRLLQKFPGTVGVRNDLLGADCVLKMEVFMALRDIRAIFPEAIEIILGREVGAERPHVGPSNAVAELELCASCGSQPPNALSISLAADNDRSLCWSGHPSSTPVLHYRVSQHEKLDEAFVGQLQAAMGVWETHIQVRFVRQPLAESRVHFEVVVGGPSMDKYAKAFFPGDFREANEEPQSMYIFEGFFTRLDESAQSDALVHELGHILGFTHERKLADGKLLEDKPDPNSIMSVTMLSRPIIGLSRLDVVGAQRIYGANKELLGEPTWFAKVIAYPAPRRHKEILAATEVLEDRKRRRVL